MKIFMSDFLIGFAATALIILLFLGVIFLIFAI